MTCAALTGIVGYGQKEGGRLDDYDGGAGLEYGFSGANERIYGVIREEVVGYEGVGEEDVDNKVSSQLPSSTSTTRFSKPASSGMNLRPVSSRHRNRNPVQRAASRLYRANTNTPATTITTTGSVNDEQEDQEEQYVTMTSGGSTSIGRSQRDCVGPEFVVRASLPSKEIVVEGGKCGGKKSLVQVIMLNGQKLDVMCNANSTTSGQLFENIIQKEHIEDNFMFGLSTLIAGDFVFLPSDTRISKAIPSSSSNTSSTVALTLFLRVRFFLPSLRGVRGFQARHLLYLQLRRSILEHQLPCNMEQLVELNGYALQAEFGDYNEREHGTRDYFLLEHYIPETMSTMTSSDNESLRNELTRAHKYKKGLDVDRAEEDFIQLAQTLPHYGGHFYTATWVLKDSSQKDVWLYVSAQGINIYERSSLSTSCGPMLYESFQWRTIRTLCYSKHYLCILPHTVKMENSKLKKYKLKMNHKKSYFTFRLASLHHQFFLRLRTEFTSLQSLSQQFGVPLKDIKNETNSLYKLEALTKPLYAFNDASVNADTEFKIEFRPSSSNSNDDVIDTRCKRSKSVNDFMLLQEEENVNEDYQNKENESPYCQMDLIQSQTGLVLDSSYLSGLGNQNLSGDKRRGVKMGIRAFSGTGQRICRSMEAVNIATSEELEQMSLQSVSIHCSEVSLPKSMEIGNREKISEAYILESSVKSTENQFLPDFHETLSDTLMEKLNNMSFAEERALRSVMLRKDSRGSLGMQITEGSDGKIYIQSIIPGGPADLTGCIFAGDQIIAVNGQNLLCFKYNDALILLKNTQQQVEFTISQTMMKKLPKLQSPTKIPNLKSRLNLSNINESHMKPLKLDTFKLLTAPQQESTQVEKYLTENCYDKTNFHKHIEPFEVPYHKHIRYEIEPNLNKSISKSCSQISGKLQLSPSTRKINMSLGLPSMMTSGYKYQFQSLDRKMSNKVLLEDVDVRDAAPIALPRSLGLSRKWRGNVKYPVTPAKKAFTTAVDKDSSTYNSLSDEEQVFI